MTRRAQTRGNWLLAVLLAACAAGQSGNEGGTGPDDLDPFPDVADVASHGDGDAASPTDNHLETQQCPATANCMAKAADAPSCPCGGRYLAYLPLRAVVAEFVASRAVVQVREVLQGRACHDPDAHPLGRPPPGTMVGGTWDGTLPCSGSCAGVAPGDEVLALYVRGAQDGWGCAEYQQCSVSRCGDPDVETAEGPTDERAGSWDLCDMECLEETRQVCEGHASEALLGGTVVLLPWRETIDLGGVLVQAEDAFSLVDYLGCREVVEVIESNDPESDDGAPTEPRDLTTTATAPAEPEEDPEDISTPSCPVEDGAADPGAAPPPRQCGTMDVDGASGLAPALQANEARCPSPEQAVLECRDVCGTLDLCSDGEVSCQECLSRCTATPSASLGSGTCMSSAIYRVDEEGCERVLDVYRRFDAATDCH